MSRKVLFYTFFNTHKFPGAQYVGNDRSADHPTLTYSWIRQRFDVWQRFAYMGISHQTYEDFQYLVLVDPRSKKFIGSLFGDVLKQDTRVKLVWMAGDWDRQGDNDPIGQINTILNPGDEYRIIRCDSDDIWHRSAAEIFSKYETNKPFIMCNKGYIYNVLTNQVKIYDDQGGSGPFHCHIRSAQEFPGTTRWVEPPHNDAYTMGMDIGPENLFIVSVHGLNTSTHFDTPQCKELLAPEQAHILLHEFKLEHSEPFNYYG